MQIDEAKTLLGFPPNSLPSSSQVKAAYIKKAMETHPDRFPLLHQKAVAESKFKLISEAYAFLHSGGSTSTSRTGVPKASYSYDYRVVKTGVPRAGRRRRNMSLVPFAFIVLGALTLGGSTASRAYRRQKDAHPSFNPFLP